VIAVTGLEEGGCGSVGGLRDFRLRFRGGMALRECLGENV
jgi:hypothetical protein